MEKLYSGWLKIFKDTVVVRLIQQPKWFKIDQDLKEKDLGYFQRSESALGSTWTVNEVDPVITLDLDFQSPFFSVSLKD